MGHHLEVPVGRMSGPNWLEETDFAPVLEHHLGAFVIGSYPTRHGCRRSPYGAGGPPQQLAVAFPRCLLHRLQIALPRSCTCLIAYLVHPFATGSAQVNVVQTIPLKSFVDNVTLVWLACVVGAKDTLFRNLHLFLETGQATVIMVSCLQIS